MSDLVGNPEDRFSHNETQIAYKHRNFSKIVDVMANSADLDQTAPDAHPFLCLYFLVGPVCPEIKSVFC